MDSDILAIKNFFTRGDQQYAYNFYKKDARALYDPESIKFNDNGGYTITSKCIETDVSTSPFSDITVTLDPDSGRKTLLIKLSNETTLFNGSITELKNLDINNTDYQKNLERFLNYFNKILRLHGFPTSRDKNELCPSQIISDTPSTERNLINLLECNYSLKNVSQEDNSIKAEVLFENFTFDIYLSNKNDQNRTIKVVKHGELFSKTSKIIISDITTSEQLRGDGDFYSYNNTGKQLPPTSEEKFAQIKPCKLKELIDKIDKIDKFNNSQPQQETPRS
jgi:hypothetical protein